MKLTKKAFREHLNQQDLESKRLAKDDAGYGPKGRQKPTKRLYGDYLYAQDRGMFDHYYQEFTKV